jgi:uncharacterized protein YqfB (UPF0267 family)
MRLLLIYLLTAIELSPGGSTHLHTNNTQNNTNNNRTTHNNRSTQITNNVEECGPCPVFASFTLAFALQLRKKHGKTTVKVRQTSVGLVKTSVRVQYTYYQDTHTLQNRCKHTHYKPPPTHPHTHTHTSQNNIKPPQYKLKQTQYKIYPNEIQQYT